MLIRAIIAPHPPIIIPNVGGQYINKTKKTIAGLKKISDSLKKEAIDSIVVASPHSPTFMDSFAINASPIFAGGLSQFGDTKTNLIFENDKELTKKIISLSENEIPLTVISRQEIDHGAVVPLYYLADKGVKLVSLSYSFLPRIINFDYGKIIRKAIEIQKKNIVFIASGDLSHRITQDAPAGYSPNGKKFDKKIIELLDKKDINGILELDESFVEDAGECGYRSIIILLGLLSKSSWQIKILSYEAPFGVGYLVADILPENK